VVEKVRLRQSELVTMELQIEVAVAVVLITLVLQEQVAQVAQVL
jgi:hypothetical protein